MNTNKAGTKEWNGLAILAFSCMYYSMDLTILNLTVPSLSADSVTPSGVIMANYKRAEKVKTASFELKQK